MNFYIRKKFTGTEIIFAFWDLWISVSDPDPHGSALWKATRIQIRTKNADPHHNLCTYEQGLMCKRLQLIV